MSETTKCHKREKVLMGVVVEAVMPIWPQPQSIEEEVRATEEAVAKFQTFLRDHRSQDRICLVVRRQYTDLCSACIDSLKGGILASSARMPEDKPKPREWRIWDMVKNDDVVWICTRPNRWVSMRDGSLAADSYQDMNLKDDIYLWNLADLLAQGGHL